MWKVRESRDTWNIVHAFKKNEHEAGTRQKNSKKKKKKIVSKATIVLLKWEI